ncbi:unnamed protein product, partial [Ectocarpus fasciculatus]
ARRCRRGEGGVGGGGAADRPHRDGHQNVERARRVSERSDPCAGQQRASLPAHGLPLVPRDGGAVAVQQRGRELGRTPVPDQRRLPAAKIPRAHGKPGVAGG